MNTMNALVDEVVEPAQKYFRQSETRTSQARRAAPTPAVNGDTTYLFPTSGEVNGSGESGGIASLDPHGISELRSPLSD